ncbi:PucR family transcriptional regulator [Nocardioides mesophilus]|uniref:Helix-turn-helix domain-containing protein n=1 Tax=Nocardioides mesophilus TaxID=433659 RepID=A0A7G9RB10_9ACTN|nr:helix-turn-helix domain-containing protein [Nocardioides mesophilus]QNN52785.1 helix-turn-helix domain-containing protein [Nocardioides mesophilus]
MVQPPAPRGPAPARPPEPAADALERQIRRAWASLVDRADAIADDISLTLFEKDREWYDKAGQDLRADVRSSTREHVRRGILTMAGRAEPGKRATDVWRETGRRRARQGVPMELVLNAYSLGTRVLWEALLEQGNRQDLGVDDHVLLMAGQRIWNALDVQNTILVESYRREAARLERRDLQRQQSFLDGLVEGRGADPEFAREAAENLGVGVDEPVACVVAPFDESLDEPLRAPEDRLERAGRVSHWHVRGGAYFGLVPLGEVGHDDLLEMLTQIAAGRVGVAMAPDGIAGFASAYLLATRVAQTVPRGQTQVVAVTDRLPEVLLSASPEVASLVVEESVGPLLAQPQHQADVLIETLLALLEHNGSPTHAAEVLYCHRNTVIYRTKQIEQLTGRSLQVPRDRLMLVLGLIATGRSQQRSAAIQG